MEEAWSLAGPVPRLSLLHPRLQSKSSSLSALLQEQKSKSKRHSSVAVGEFFFYYWKLTEAEVLSNQQYQFYRILAYRTCLYVKSNWIFALKTCSLCYVDVIKIFTLMHYETLQDLVCEDRVILDWLLVWWITLYNYDYTQELRALAWVETACLVTISVIPVTYHRPDFQQFHGPLKFASVGNKSH